MAYKVGGSQPNRWERRGLGAKSPPFLPPLTRDRGKAREGAGGAGPAALGARRRSDLGEKGEGAAGS